MSFTTHIHIPGYASTSGSASSSNSRKQPDSRKTTSADTAVDDKADLKSIASGYSGCSTHTQLSSRSNTLKLAIRTDDLATSAHSKSKSSTPSTSSKHRTAPQKLAVRRARCPPEFLEEIAKSGVPHGLKTRAESTFKVVSGLEAEALFDHFVGKQVSLEKSITVKGNPHSSGRLVFAITLLDAGRRVVDYYMTWRGKIPRVRDHGERRLSYLDSEFRRVARSLDNHYKSIISIVDNASPASTPLRKQVKPSRPETPPPEPPPKDDPPRSDAESTNSSVISLPLLNMIRNVPFSHRQMLRVTNPDTASIVSAEGAPAPASRTLDTIAEGVEASTISPSRRSPTSHGDTQNRDRRPKGNSPKHSTSSSQSSDRTKKRAHTDDSRSKRSHRHKRDDERSSKHNPKKRHYDTHGRRKRDSDTDSDNASEFTIVLLDDNAEKDLLSWHGLNRNHSTPQSSSTTLVESPWTGPLVNANRLIFHTGPRSGPSPAEDHSEDESDNSDESDDKHSRSYEASVVIPQAVTPALNQYLSPAPSAPMPLSYARSSASSYRSNSSGSSGSSSLTSRPGERPVSIASSAASYRTAYTYPTHRSSIASSTSSYVPAWINPRHYVLPDTSPLTGIQTPVSYHPIIPY